MPQVSLKFKNLIFQIARGIGFAVAKSIAQLGGGVAVIDVLQEPVEEFQTLSKRYNVKASYHQADITNKDSLESAFADAVKAVGQLHGGFTAAGICIDEKLIEADWEHSKKVLDINVLGTFWSAKLIAKHLVDTNTPGSIVMVASLSGQGVHIPVQACTIYNASKAAVKGMVGPLATELGKHNIRVNSISPGEHCSNRFQPAMSTKMLTLFSGAIKTPMTAALETDNPAILNYFRDAAPVGRLGIPQDLTTMVCFLLSDAGSFTTGADMLITGKLIDQSIAHHELTLL